MGKKKKAEAGHETATTEGDAFPSHEEGEPSSDPGDSPENGTLPEASAAPSGDGAVSDDGKNADGPAAAVPPNPGETGTGRETSSGDPDTNTSDAGDPDAENSTSENEGDDDDPDGEDEETDGDEPADDSLGEGDAPALPLAAVVEAVLFAAREPLKPAQIARAVGKRTRQEAVREAVGELNVHYLETGRSFEIAEISGRYQLMSRPEFAPHIMRIYPKRDLAGEKEKSQRLTSAALDTLAIIAYKQPVTRADIEHIRGVGCGPVLKALLERDSIRIVGKRLDLLGQPLVYGTTESFLAEFGMGSLDELPMRGDFLALFGEDSPPIGAVEAVGDGSLPAGNGDGPENAASGTGDGPPASGATPEGVEENDPEPTPGGE